MGAGSRWQTGPAIFARPRYLWPLSSTDEIAKIKRRAEAAGVSPPPRNSRPAWRSASHLLSSGIKPALQLNLKRGIRVQKLVMYCLKRHNLDISARVLARVMQANLPGDRNATQWGRYLQVLASASCLPYK